MHYCRAFVHPAVYEGFGMTPIEAAASGCKELIVSNAACLPEIYGNSAHYINPDVPNVKIDDILREKTGGVDLLLSGEKYSWKKAAESLYEIMKSEL